VRPSRKPFDSWRSFRDVLRSVHDALRSVHVFTSARSRRTTLVYFLLGSVAVLGGSALVHRQLPHLTNPAVLQRYVGQFGRFAPAVFVGLHASQIVVAPIPGQVLAFAAGYLFGPVYGTLYSALGAAIGSYVAFSLSRRFGRPYVERVIAAETLDEFDAVVEERGLFALFVVFLLPGLPDDVVCFAGGLTELDVRKMVVVSVAGRLPGYFVITLAGAQVAAEEFVEAGVIVAVLLALSAVGYLKRDALLTWLRP
jgi:uncharacterized membrane protein YdjX (TVP38/TMEM64 family)